VIDFNGVNIFKRSRHSCIKL